MGCWMGRWSHPGTAAEVGCIHCACLFGDSRLHFLKKNPSQVENTHAFERSENTWFFTFRKTKALHCYSFRTKETPLRVRMLCGYVISCFNDLQWRRVVWGALFRCTCWRSFPGLIKYSARGCRFLTHWLWGGHFIFISNVLGSANFCLASCPKKSLRASICSSEDHCGQATMWLT